MLGVVLALVIGFVIAASLISMPDYSLVPGEALPVSGLITVPRGQHHTVKGQVLLTDVGVTNLKLIGFIAEQFDSDATIVHTSDLTGGVPVSEYQPEGVVDMEESQLTAESVALRQLGYQVPERDAGVTVYVIGPGTPAWNVLKVGDVITSVDGTPTTNPDQLQAAIRAHHPGDVVTLRVGTVARPDPGRPVSVRLSSTVVQSKSVVGGKTVVSHSKVALLGIGDPAAPYVAAMGTQPEYDFPFKVSINSDDIGGPSAGLAFTLGIVNTLSNGHLTGGRTIAATGTIDPDGSVGDVGGVKQKTVAVERAGASIFFVPAQELPVARSMATPGLKVYAVSSVGQVLDDLRHLGGVVGTDITGPRPGPGGHSVPTDWQQSPWS